MENLSLPQNYQLISVIGEGAFGKVFKAKDKKTDTLVAIKDIKFQNQDQGIPSTALRQIATLKNLKQHPYIVPLRQVIYKAVQQNLKIIFDYYQYDLKKFIHSKNYVIDQKQSKTIIKKILAGIDYCHQKKVLHRDLKPQNILVDYKGNVKLADFGLARLLMIPDKTLTHQVETLWYRAPQILLGQKKYTSAVDVWAVGCIFAQTFLKRPLFLGTGYQIEQVFKIFEILGTPRANYWPNIKNLPDFKGSFPKWQKPPLKNYVSNLSEKGIQFLERLLELNPDKRLTAQQALEHEYLSDIILND